MLDCQYMQEISLSLEATHLNAVLIHPSHTWKYTLHYIPTLTSSSANPICTGEQCRAKSLRDTQYCYICYQYTLLSSVESGHVHSSWGIRRTKLSNHNSVSVTRVALLPGPAQLIRACSELSRAWERGYKKRSANVSAQHICSSSCIAILNSQMYCRIPGNISGH